jgi:hypothetical protein
MPPLHQLDTIYLKFLSKVLAGGSFGKALEHQDNRRAGPTDALKHSVAQQIVYGSAGAAAIVQHRSPVIVVGLLSLR